MATEVDTSTLGGTSRSGLLSTLVSPAGTPATTVETDLFTYTFPVSAFISSSAAIRLTFWYVTAANGNTKTVRVYFGGTLMSSRAVADNAAVQQWTVNILRVASNSQLSVTQKVTATAAGTSIELGSATITESTAIIIKVTGQNGTGTANDIQLRGATLEFLQ